MAIEGGIQTLLAAFSFGLLMQAAITASSLFIKGHGSILLRNSRRLVLVLFLATVALWAPFDFFNFVISTSSPGVCQAMVIVSTSLDQIARVLISTFLLWSVAHVTKSPAEKYGLGGLILLRLIVGMTFVGFARPQFAPLCIAQSSSLPVSIMVLGLDALTGGILIIRILTLGLLGLGGKTVVSPSMKQEQSKALTLCTTGFVIWTGASVTMILGLEPITLLLRTAVPAIGLLILIGFITVHSGSLVLNREEDRCTPEAQSPFLAPPPVKHSDSTHKASVAPHGYTKKVPFSKRNGSNAPTEPPASAFPHHKDNGYKKSSRSTTRAREPENDVFTNMTNNNRSSSGIFGKMLAAPLATAGAGIHEARAPQVHHSATRMDFCGRNGTSVPRAAVAEAPKKSFFGRLMPPPKRKITISKPVLAESESMSAQPFARMRTVDLATAAASELDRRTRMMDLKLTKKRQVLLPPTMSPSEALQKSISTRRKEAPGVVRPDMGSLGSNVMPLNESGDSSNKSGLLVNLSGNSTSTSLSPGREDVRRRSPRQTSSFDAEKQDFGRSPFNMNPTKIAPPRPRMPEYQSGRKRPTAMVLNNVVYDNPGIVKSIINESPALLTRKNPNDVLSERIMSSSDSLLSRPGPCTKDDDQNRPLYNEPSPIILKRSKSASSVVSKKSNLQNTLPPLPQPPTSAAKLERLLPNETRRMTVDEKISLLFPAPPGVRLLHNRRSSVPSIPRIPSGIVAQDLTDRIASEERKSNFRGSMRTTNASFGGVSSQKAPLVDEVISSEHDSYRFSATSYRNLANIEHDGWIPNFGASHNKDDKESERSILIIPIITKDDSSSEVATKWKSSHAPLATVNPATQQNAKTMQQKADNLRELPDLPTNGDMEIASTDDEGEEMISIMLDQFEEVLPSSMRSKDRQSYIFNPHHCPLSFTKTAPPACNSRIGDHIPAFSERRNIIRSRAITFPPPLFLGSNEPQVTVVLPVLQLDLIDTPNRAIKEIQEQLRKFEEPKGESLSSLFRNVPGNSPFACINDPHLGLLENLEIEIGQQETNWQQMQRNFARDSANSETLTPPLLEADPSSKRSSVESSYVLNSHSRRAGIKSSLTADDRSLMTTSISQSLEISTASTWQQRSAEDREQYLQNAPTTLQLRNPKVLNLPMGQLASPTPPESPDSRHDSVTEIDSDSGEEDAHEVLYKPLPDVPKLEVVTLWKPRLSLPAAKLSHIGFHQATLSQELSPKRAALRPAQRQDSHPLRIESSSLWSPRTCINTTSHFDLWGSNRKTRRPKSIPARPKTQRPQRKSRRATLLPDIVESPSPLPHKRDTLGIFQFPWGEKSDSAFYQPPVLYLGPDLGRRLSIVNINLDSQSMQTDSELFEYPSSYFEPYEQEDGEYENDSDLNSDDDFDESTLWEISNLLGSQDIPSRDSLLPLPRIIEDYDDETDDKTDSEEELPPVNNVDGLSLTVKPHIIRPLVPKYSTKGYRGKLSAYPDVDSNKANMGNVPKVLSSSREGAPPRSSYCIWNPPTAQKELWKPQLRLDQPESIWMAQNLYNSVPLREVGDSKVSNPRQMKLFVPEIKSKDLWSTTNAAVPKKKKSPNSTGLWNQASNTRASSPSVAASLWAPRQLELVTEAAGLFSCAITDHNYRTTSKAPAALDIPRKVRLSTATLPPLKTQDLWSSKKDLAHDHHWISVSTIRASSPSLYSSSSSGRFSPETSDSSSIASTSTKASSLWRPMPMTESQAPAVPPWWNLKATAKAEFSHRQEESKFSHQLLDSMSECKSSPQSSRNGWQSRTSIVNNAEMKETNEISQTVVAQYINATGHTSIGHQYRPFASVTDWKTALSEVTEAGVSQENISGLIGTPEKSGAVLAQVLHTNPPSVGKAITSKNPEKIDAILFASITTGQRSAIKEVSSARTSKSITINNFAPTRKLWSLDSASAAAPTLKIKSLWFPKPEVPANTNYSPLPTQLLPLTKKPGRTFTLNLANLTSTAIWEPSVAIKIPAKHWPHNSSTTACSISKNHLWSAAPAIRCTLESSPNTPRHRAAKIYLGTQHASTGPAVVKMSSSSTSPSLPSFLIQSNKLWDPLPTPIVSDTHWLQHRDVVASAES